MMFHATINIMAQLPLRVTRSIWPPRDLTTTTSIQVLCPTQTIMVDSPWILRTFVSKTHVRPSSRGRVRKGVPPRTGLSATWTRVHPPYPIHTTLGVGGRRSLRLRWGWARDERSEIPSEWAPRPEDLAASEGWVYTIPIGGLSYRDSVLHYPYRNYLPIKKK